MLAIKDKDYREKLIKLSVFLTDISEIESEYAERMRHVGNSLRYQRVGKAKKATQDKISELADSFPIQSPPRSNGDDPDSLSIRIPESIEEGDDEDQDEDDDEKDNGGNCSNYGTNLSANDNGYRRSRKMTGNKMLNRDGAESSEDGNSSRDTSRSPTSHHRSMDSQTSSPKSPSTSSTPLYTPPQAACVNEFFKKVGGSHELIGEYHKNIADLLNMELISDVNGCLGHVSDTYNRSKAAWKDRRDTYREFEDTANVVFKAVDVGYQYSCASLVSELSKITAELEIRRSGKDQRTEVESNTIKSFTGGSGSYRKDIWTQVQQYHRSLGDVEHGISALINFVFQRATWLSPFFVANQQSGGNI